MNKPLAIMKKIFLLAFVTVSAFSCKDLGKNSDMSIQKDSLGTVVGNDKDDKGCVASAGYTWSELKIGYPIFFKFHFFSKIHISKNVQQYR